MSETKKIDNKKKKILYVVEAMGGGVFTYIVDLANELVNEYDIYIAYAVRQQTPLNYKEYFDNRVTLIELKNFHREIGLLQEFKAINEIKNIEKRIKPDVIHLHSSKAGVIGRVAFNGKKIPVFYTPHGYSFLMQNCENSKRFIYKAIENIMAKRNCITISCSLGEHKETIKMTSKAYYIDNAVNLEKLQTIISGVEIKEHPFTVFTLGRICFQKNPTLFNQIAELLSDVKFVWIGDGELHDELQADNIEITGWVDRKKAIEYAVNADVFILTSLWEGLPMSLLEAMYMKKTCVVNNVIGNNDVIHNNDNGYVCNSVNDFVNAIIEIRNKGSKQYIEKAYKDILDHYNTRIQAEQYSYIYKKYMNKE